MKRICKATGILLCLVTGIVSIAALAPAAHGQNAPRGKPTHGLAASLIPQMVGTWNVQQRMWPGSGANPSILPPAIARRQLIKGLFLEETLTLAPGSKEQPFTRIAYFDYNAVSQKYEYFSLDTRAPQMMNERSRSAEGGMHGRSVLTLYGGSFVAPRWGKAINAAFRYRLTIGAIAKNQQIVRLYLTPESGKKAKEFLAFEYRYIRQI